MSMKCPPHLMDAAEARLTQSPTGEVTARSDTELLKELQIHQIELEMQNETLRQSQRDLRDSRDRYADLYDFAPVGYLTLTNHGMIEEINLAATNLLGVEREKLLQQPFARFVSPKDADRWHLQIGRAHV